MPTALELFDRKFPHDDQIKLCARHLEVMREDLGDAWWKLGAAAAHDDEHAVALSPEWTPEQRSLAKHFIRHATESANHPTTVDFVTRATIGHIQAKLTAQKRCRTGALKQWDKFTHEHMVPGAEVLRILTDPDYPPNQTERLAPLLGALSWRALITGTKRRKEKDYPTFEVGQLEPEFGDSLPPLSRVSGLGALTDIRTVPPQYYAFIRYDAANLLGELVPVSDRAEGMVEEYLVYKARVSTAAVAGPAPAVGALLAESPDS
jgi:hypothetical protein